MQSLKYIEFNFKLKYHSSYKQINLIKYEVRTNKKCSDSM